MTNEHKDLPEASGTLHDDGYFVFKGQPPEGSNKAGWKMPFYTEAQMRAALAAHPEPAGAGVEHEPACNLRFPATLNTADDYCDCAEIRAFRAKRAAASEVTEQDDELTTLSNELLALKYGYCQLELKLGATEHLLATLRATISAQESLLKHYAAKYLKNAPK